MKIAVVGAGPCGALASLLLLENGITVDLISLDNFSQSNARNLETKLKLVKGDCSTYDLNQFLKISLDGKKATFFRSKRMGGFSNVWGATWGSKMVSMDPSWVRHYEEITNRVSKSLGQKEISNMQQIPELCGCDCMSFLKKIKAFCVSNFEKSKLAVINSGCNCVALGETTCSHGSVWNSTSLINECIKYTNFQFIQSYDVKTILSDLGGVHIALKDKLLSYDHVVLAAGPLGTSSIILESDLKIKEVSLSETRMGYLPFFRFKLNSGHNGSFGFAQYSFDIADKDSKTVAHIQLYAHSEIYFQRILGIVPGWLRGFAKFLIKPMLPHLGIALIYLNSEYSNSLIISRKVSGIGIQIKSLNPKLKMKSFSSLIWRSFLDIRLVPLLPVLSWAPIGESYHLGAAEEHLDEYGFLNEEPRISVAGSFALPKILPGPITHAAMAQSSRLVEKIVYQNFESN